MLRIFASVLALSFLLSVTSVAQDETLHEIGGGPDDRMGSSLDNAGDIDHDGYDDFVVGAPGFGGGGTAAGRVEVRSGRTGAVIWSKVGATGDRLGQDVAGGFDVDGDGTCDFAGGFNRFDSNSTGGVIVWSGATGAVLMSRTTINGLGFSVDGAGDLDGDGRSEVLVGLPDSDILFGASDVGRFQVWKQDPASTTPINLLSRLGSRADGRLGQSVANAGDVDGDGVDDIAVGEPGYQFTLAPFVYSPGRVLLYSGQAAGTGQPVLIRTLDATDLFNEIGWSLDAGLDVDGDGTPDVIAGSDTEGCEVFSGADGSSLHLFDNAMGDMAGVGRAVALIGDRTFDGMAEMVISLTNGGDGALVIVDGGFGFTLGRLEGEPGSGFGKALAAGCDLDGDGRDDLVVGAPDEDLVSGPFTQQDAGVVRAYPFSPTSALLGALGHGDAITAVGDLDGDGVRDIAIGIPEGGISMAGEVALHSGADLTTISTVIGFQQGDAFGSAVAGFDDDTGDGTPDFLVGAPEQDWLGLPRSGVVLVRAGPNGGPVRFVDAGIYVATDIRHGSSLALLDDLDGDGRPEFAASAPRGGLSSLAPDNGIVLIHSGSTGAVIGALGGLDSNEGFGKAIAAIPDVNGDGVCELAVGAPIAMSFAGRFDVYDGASLTGTPVCLCSVTGTTSSQLGESIAHAGDVNGDGTADVIVGAPDEVGGSGHARVYCALTGTMLLDIPNAQPFDKTGQSVSGAGDMNGDGLDDVIVGAPGDLEAFPTIQTVASRGSVRIVSGTGEVLRTFRGRESTNFLGQSVAGLGDIDGDGFDEIAFTRDRAQFLSFNQDVYFVKPRRLDGVEAFGEGTPGCRGKVRLLGNSPPRVGNTQFTIITDGAPPLTSGVTLLAESTARLDPGVDLFGLGLVFHLDPTLAPGAIPVTTVTDASGFASIPSPLPNLPILAGFDFLLQGIWFDGPCQPGFGYSMTNGLEITLLP